MEIIRICGIEYDSPTPAFAARIETRDTVATDTGEAVMPICDATEAAAIGLSGRMLFLIAMSPMIGNMV